MNQNNQHNIGDKVLMKSILEFETYASRAKEHLIEHDYRFTIKTITHGMVRDTFTMEETECMIWYDHQIDKVKPKSKPNEQINDRFEILDL